MFLGIGGADGPTAIYLTTKLAPHLLPSVAPLIGMLMLGNLFRESGVVERLTETAREGLINVMTIFLGLSVGATAGAAGESRQLGADAHHRA